MEILSKFVETFLLALAPVLASLVVAYLAVKIKELWAEIQIANPNVAYWVAEAVEMAVAAAEQAGLNDLIQDKKAYALKLASDYLFETYKLKIDLVLVAGAIEAELLRSHADFEKVRALKAGE